MTVPVQTPVVSYAEDGATLSFPVPFYYLDPDHLVAVRIDADGTRTELYPGADFEATKGDDAAGGTLTLYEAGEDGATLRIQRQTPRAQEADYLTNGAFTADSHEQTLDRMALIAQEQDIEQARGFRMPVGETGPTMPDAKGRANGFFGFDSVGAFALRTAQQLANAIAPSLPSTLRGDPGGDASQVGTLFAAIGMNIAAPITRIRTTGYAAEGDGGQGDYKRAAGEPAHDGKFQDALGAWWELDTDVVYFEQFGAIDDAQVTWNGAFATSATGTDNAAAINAAIAYAKERRGVRVAARGTGWFGTAGKISIDSGRVVFGNRMTPEAMQIIALDGFAGLDDDGVVEVARTRACIDGVTIVVPDSVYNWVTGAGTKIAPLRYTTIQDGYYHPRIWNVDLVGGYRNLHAEGLEAKFLAVRGNGGKYGAYVTGADNEFIGSCTFTGSETGLYATAGIEGALHLVRNRDAAYIKTGFPVKCFLFVDTPKRYGITCESLRAGEIDCYYTKVGVGRADPATEEAYYVKLTNSPGVVFNCVGLYKGPSDPGHAEYADQTNVYFGTVPDGPTAVADGVATVDCEFRNFDLQDVPLAKNNGNLDLMLRNRFPGCRGTTIAQARSDAGRKLGRAFAFNGTLDDAGNRVTITRFLGRRPRTAVNTVARVAGGMHLRKDGDEDCVLDLSLRIPFGTDTNAGGTLTERPGAKEGAADYSCTVEDVAYDVKQNSVTVTIQGPVGFASTGELWIDELVTAAGVSL